MAKPKRPATKHGANANDSGGAGDSGADGGGDLEELVAKQLPGWHVDRDERSMTDALYMEDDVKAEPGAAIEDLERKFLKKASNRAAAGGRVKPSDSVKSSDKVGTLRVKPDDGGPSKVADVTRDGQIKIVQG